MISGEDVLRISLVHQNVSWAVLNWYYTSATPVLDEYHDDPLCPVLDQSRTSVEGCPSLH